MDRSIILVLSILLFTIIHSASAQEERENVFHFKAPNPNLKDFFLPSHKELPRIGYQDGHGVNNFKLANSMGIKEKQRLKKRLKDIEINTNLFIRLSLVRIMDDTFSKMDREQLTKELHFSSTSENKENYLKKIEEREEFYKSQPFQDNSTSRLAQEQLLSIASMVVTEDSRQKYFCPLNGECTFKEGFAYMWGGRGANEFDRIDGYRSFVEDNFDDIRKWAASLPEVLYMVDAISLPIYDFQRNVYRLRIKPEDNSKFVFRPIESYEKVFGQSPGKGHLYYDLSLTTEEAKALKKRTLSTLYVVYKVKIDEEEYVKGKIEFRRLGYLNYLNINYHLASPIIELYEDKALTRKVIEIDLTKF